MACACAVRLLGTFMSDFIHMRILLQIIKYLQIPTAIPLPALEESWGVEVRF